MIARPSSFGRLFLFHWLDRSGGRVPLHTIGWRIEDEPDEWTNRFLRFKGGQKPDVCGGAHVLLEALKELVHLRKLDPATTGLVTALSHASTKASPTSVLYI